MKDTNIFKHAPKELVMDAFLTWLFYYLDELDKEDNGNKVVNLLHDLGVLISENEIEFLKVERQAKGKHGRIDLIIKLKIRGKEEKILFENKTDSEISQGQLGKYKIDFPNCKEYIFLKLAYINSVEEKICSENQYIIITSKILSHALKEIESEHEIIKMYNEYITEKYVNFIESFEMELLQKNNSDILASKQAQGYLMNKVFNELSDIVDKNSLYILSGSSSGKSYVRLDIKKQHFNTVDGQRIEEFIWWKLDKRKNKFFLRLNQYASIADKHKEVKIKRLFELREIVVKVLLDFDVKLGLVSNKGRNESEIVIMFLNENNIKYLLQNIKMITRRVLKNIEAVKENYK